MGKRGPQRTPTPILKLHGSHRAKTREKKEPKPAITAPVGVIKLDARGKRIYATVVKWIASMGLQAATDGNAIARYAADVVRYNDCAKFCAKNGETYTQTVMGVMTVKRYPESVLMSQLSVALLRLEREFGLTPSARASLQVDPKETNGDIESRYFG